MKKHLILLLLPLMLCACNGGEGESESHGTGFGPTEEGTPTESGTPTEEGTPTEGDGPTEESTSSEDTTDTSSLVIETDTLYVPLINTGWSGTLDSSARCSAFVEAINSPILSSITTTGYVQVNDFGTAYPNQLCIGSKNSEGSITFNFSVQVVSIKYAAQPYCKYDDYNNVWRVDEAPISVTIDGTEYALDQYSDGVPMEVQINKEFNPPVTSTKVEVKETSKRVYLSQLEVTYIVA